jgi:formylglycine-generating enzyme required for sulfatase activity
MVLVPAGCFIMGSSEEEINSAYENCENSSAACEAAYAPDWFAGEVPLHQICFNEPFLIDRYEVTNAQFRLFGGQAADESHWTGDNRPRETISWYEADAYCKLRGARLPTEAEWEYACRAGTTTAFSFGDGADSNYAWVGEKESHAVGQKKPNNWGLYDMHGNVWEWCADWYDSVKLCLDRFYDYVQPGGYIVLDDYGDWEGCRIATDEFLKKRSLDVKLIQVDYTGFYFQKPLE